MGGKKKEEGNGKRMEENAERGKGNKGPGGMVRRECGIWGMLRRENGGNAERGKGNKGRGNAEKGKWGKCREGKEE